MRPFLALDFLTRTDGSPVAYALRAAAVAMIGTIVIILVIAQFLAAPESSEPNSSTAAAAITLLIIWPLIATAVIALLSRSLKQHLPTYWHAAAATAIGFALVLGLLLGLEVGLVYAWPFFIYSVTFLAWQLRSEWQAWLMTALVHSLVNVIPVVLL